MIVFAVDPSLTCTGWAKLDGSGTKPKLMRIGAVMGDDKIRCPLERGFQVANELMDDFEKECEDVTHIIVESPQTVTKGKLGKRSNAHLPSYGVGVMSCYMILRMAAPAAVLVGDKLVIETVSATTWAMGMRIDDKHKSNRVLAVETDFELEHGSLGVKTKAGNIADAALLGRWYINNWRLREAAE